MGRLCLVSYLVFDVLLKGAGMIARLLLEDGTVIEGQAFGAKTDAVFELVFNTSMTGYQEILTDPSYRGQGVLFTVSHIGNVGINLEDDESVKRHHDCSSSR